MILIPFAGIHVDNNRSTERLRHPSVEYVQTHSEVQDISRTMFGQHIRFPRDIHFVSTSQDPDNPLIDCPPPKSPPGDNLYTECVPKKSIGDLPVELVRIIVEHLRDV